MSSKDEILGAIEKLLPDQEEVKKNLTEDARFIDRLSVTVAEQLLKKGYVEDRLLNRTETLEILGLKNYAILLKLKDNKKNPLLPVKLHETAHPKWRLSDVNRYIGNLQAVRK